MLHKNSKFCSDQQIIYICNEQQIISEKLKIWKFPYMEAENKQQ